MRGWAAGGDSIDRRGSLIFLRALNEDRLRINRITTRKQRAKREILKGRERDLEYSFLTFCLSNLTEQERS
jgi:hypothetical protein